MSFEKIFQSFRFSGMASEAKQLHNKLLCDIALGYLDENVNNGHNFHKFKSNIKTILPLPVYQTQTVTQLFDTLEQKGYLSVNNYEQLVALVNDIDVRIVDLIHKTQEHMNKVKETEACCFDTTSCHRTAGNNTTPDVTSVGTTFNIKNIRGEGSLIAIGNAGHVTCTMGKRPASTCTLEGQESDQTKRMRQSVSEDNTAGQFRKEDDTAIRGKELHSFYINGWHKSVGQLYTSHGNATVFRVGERCVMTAFHAVEKDIKKNLKTIIEEVQSDPDRKEYYQLLLTNLIGSDAVGADIEAKLEYSINKWVENSEEKIMINELIAIMDKSKFFVSAGNVRRLLNRSAMAVCFGRLAESEECPTYSIKNNIPYYNKPDDIVIMEIDWTELPKPFYLDKSKTLQDAVHLVSYPAFHGREQTLDPRCRISDELKVKTDFSDAIKWWKEKLPEKNLEDLHKHYNDAFSVQGKVLFHCSESNAHGASGSPGLVNFDSERPQVQLMMQEGFPHFAYDKRYRYLLKDVPKQFLIERGISMNRVYTLLSYKPSLTNLRNEIFHS